MKPLLYLFTVIALLGCGKNEGNGGDVEPQPIKLSHRVIKVMPDSPNFLDYVVVLSDSPGYAIIKIVGGNGGYTVAKVKEVEESKLDGHPRLKAAVEIVDDSFIIASMLPTQDSGADPSLAPLCEDVYVVTDKEGKQAAFGMTNMVRADMGDPTQPNFGKSSFLTELESYDK